MKIATFNANSVRARLPVLSRWLDSARPDILCIQETKVENKDFPVGAFEEVGYHVVFSGERKYNGVAVASLDKPRSVRVGIDDNEDSPDEARIIAVDINGIHVVNTYVPQGTDVESPRFQYKLRWFKRLKEYFARHYTPKDMLLWTGDLNVAPEPMDVHDPKRLLGHVCYHPDLHKVFAETVSWGFEDVFRKHKPDPEEYSFFDYRVPNSVQRKLGWRIDHLLATPPLAKTSTNAWIDLEPRGWERPSDHTFVVSDFDV